MNVMITGGTGFIGSRLALRLLERGDNVRILGQVNNPAEAANQHEVEERGAELCLGSVTNRDLVFEALQGIDVVYHLAAAQHEAHAPDQLFWDVNVEGTKNVLEGSVAAGVKRLVHGSTIGVYGSAMEGEINARTPTNPDNIYGVTKLEGEKLVRSFQDRLPVVIIRISETYGAGDRRLLKLFKSIKQNLFFMIGRGENLHHLIYIDDLIEGLRVAATADEALGQTFVLAGKEPLTTNEMVNTIAKELDGKIRFRAPLSLFMGVAVVLESVLRPLGIQPPLHRRRMDFFKKSFVFAPELWAGLAGFSPRYSFEQGVAETARWYGKMGYL